jgi:hypothetical protein
VLRALQYDDFVKTSLPKLESWPRKKVDVLKLTIDYINLSASGYLDSRLFQVMQTWEFLARAWGQKGTLTPPVTELRNEIKRSYKSWRKTHSHVDSKGDWGNRLLFAFGWEKAKDAILNLAASRGLNLSTLGIDLDILKEARDSVAHTGKMPEHLRATRRETVDLLLCTQKSLQLILLKELDFHGKVYVQGLEHPEVRSIDDLG